MIASAKKCIVFQDVTFEDRPALRAWILRMSFLGSSTQVVEAPILHDSGYITSSGLQVGFNKSEFPTVEQPFNNKSSMRYRVKEAGLS